MMNELRYKNKFKKKKEFGVLNIKYLTPRAGIYSNIFSITTMK